MRSQRLLQDHNNIVDDRKKDPFDKKVFHNLPFNIKDTFRVDVMEPFLNLTTNGIVINNKAQIFGCVINGRIAGEPASTSSKETKLRKNSCSNTPEAFGVVCHAFNLEASCLKGFFPPRKY